MSQEQTLQTNRLLLAVALIASLFFLCSSRALAQESPEPSPGPDAEPEPAIMLPPLILSRDAAQDVDPGEAGGTGGIVAAGGNETPGEEVSASPLAEPYPPATALNGSNLVLLLVFPEREELLLEHFQLELSAQGLRGEAGAPPEGVTAIARAAEAQERATEAGACAAIWLEQAPASVGRLGTLVRAVAAGGAEVRHALLPTPTGEISPRVFAVVAASLIDELVSPPELPVAQPLPGEPEDTRAGTQPSEELVAVVVPEVPAVAVEQAGQLRTLVAGVDFLPYLGFSTRHRGQERRRFSFGVLGSLTGEIEGFELTGLFGITRQQLRGFQLGGVFNFVGGDVSGFQLGGVFNLAGGDVSGSQLGGVFNLVGGDVSGFQLGGVFNLASEEVTGFQLSGVASVALGPLRGGQLGGVVNLSRGDGRGAQVAGVVNAVTGDMVGLQLAGVINSSRSLRGAQIGLINVARGEVRGAQIGLVNYARSSTFSLGLVNIIPDGRHNLDLTGSDTGFVNVSYLHGSRYLHNIYSLGIRVQDGQWSLGLGIGGHIPIGNRLFVDIDLLAHFLNAEVFQGRHNTHSQLRAVLGIQIVRWLALTVGASYNVLVTSEGGGEEYPLFGGRILAESDRVTVVGWPGFQVGLRFL
jgi:hypothetical protein